MEIPGPAKERLLYLLKLLEKGGYATLTSTHIESLTGWSRDSIRKDISYLAADIGRASGYDSAALENAIKKTLRLDRKRKICIVGLGRLGSAYLNFSAFQHGEYELTAGFDANVNRVEILSSPVPLYPTYKMNEIINRFAIEISLLCVPEDQAQAVADKLIAAGIRGIVNFAPVALRVPPDIAVRDVYVVDELRSLSIRIHTEKV
ncbi:MAG: redox-sensing transcriptional repressor Rex [Treponema sp.]|jgi:redox-sensing transcriptional repressor|nr:redox-sensing transcriptional repressor Rex [Treponema sp.]